MQLSIDLEREIESLTQRQSLNDVHFAVALLRRVVVKQPRQINITVSKKRFVLEHDGETIGADEGGLLQAVLDERRAPAERQRALSALEAEHGVAILTALLTSTQARLQSAFVVETKGGRMVRAGPLNNDRGCRLELVRAIKKPRDVLREVRFYARHARPTITVNGRPINSPLELGECMLLTRKKLPIGRVQVGLPRGRDLSRVRYFKHGIYFGLRTSLPSDGRVVDGAFDSLLAGIEDNFRDSIREGGQALRRARRDLYDEAARRFGELGERDRARLRERFLRLPADEWTVAMSSAPLFDRVGAPLSLSAEELRRRGATDGAVRYVLRAQQREFARDVELLMLRADEVLTVRPLLNAPLVRVLKASPVLPAPRAPREAEPLSSVDELMVAVGGETPHVADGVLYLPRGHPALARLEAWRGSPANAERARALVAQLAQG